MATAPQASLPLFYKDLMPLNTRDHANWKSKTFERVDFFAGQHAVPVTVDEFADCQRTLPIVFSSGENSVPIALMGLNEGVNVYIDADGKMTEPVYVPAYVRRYPFLLARLRQDSEELSLCFDPTAGVLGNFDDGRALFKDNGEPSEYTAEVLQYCENFEQSGQRTRAFMDELAKAELIMDGEIAITQNDQPDKPFIYRGFRMVDETKLRELPVEKLEEYNKSGLLVLIYAHLFSLGLMRTIFARQMEQGKVPQPQMAPAN